VQAVLGGHVRVAPRDITNLVRPWVMNPSENNGVAAAPGVNPSLMITALAERAMSLWPNKGDADPRPPLGSGYARQTPIMPRKPIVPKGAPVELGLDAKKKDVIPLYPY